MFGVSASLAEKMAELVEPGGAVACQPTGPLDACLFPEERRYIARAVPKRRAEFATARVCARRALAQLGIAPVPLLPHVDRSPRWPAGTRGSISHAGGYCIAAVTAEPRVSGIGIDLEEDGVMARNVEKLICTIAEQEALQVAASGKLDSLLKLYFSAKEAVYKCQYAITGEWLGFQDIELAFDFCTNAFRIERLHRANSLGGAIQRLQGRFALCSGFVLTAATLLVTD